MVTIQGIGDAAAGVEFDAGAVAVTDASNWVCVAVIQNRGRPLLVQLEAGTNSLEHVRITTGAYVGAHAASDYVQLAADTDLNADTAATPFCCPDIGASPAIAGSGKHQVWVDSPAVETAIWAKKTTNNTTLRVRGVIR